MRVPAFAAGALPVVILEQGSGIDQRGERAQLLGGAVHQGCGLGFLRQVALQGGGIHAKGARRLDRAVGIFFRAMIMNRHIPARHRQVQGDSPSQPLGRAGDENVFHVTKPTVFFTSSMMGAAMARARAAPLFMVRSISAGSASKRRISLAMGSSLATVRSARAALKPENCWPANWAITASRS